ncbi:MAG: methylmalonyl-CoA mutase family protein [Chloroflexi bacterium]|nr:methylmalonyl-CoA mutase family protein [Chloroflexota bacterium]MCL5074787.1 methylmalonyl-CoA mutase family protein [Chloroflexota bacterium]
MSTPADLAAKERGRWEKETVGPTVQRCPERQEHFATSSQIPIQRLYGPDDTAQMDYLSDLGFPGEYPFTRGVQPTMYRGRLWTMRQYAGYGTAEESNRRYRYLLEEGQTGLSVAFDLPTQLGYDSNHPLALGEVGKVGVAIDSLEDMERLFDQIPLDKVSTSMTINATAAIILGMYIAVAKRRSITSAQLMGTIQNDILKEYIARGTYIFPPKPSLRLVTDLIAYCSAHLPRWNSISISGYHIREAGATAVQELAFTLANAITYVEAALAVGLDLDDFGPRLSFFFNAHNDLFEEVAKFRAGRRLWAKIMRHRFGAKDPRSWMLRFHAQTAGSTLTAQQPENNIVRTTIQALAAVLGGTQSLHTNSMDEALALPSEKAVRIALRTQQILAYESGVADTIDPLAGSYYLEALTNEMERRAQEYLSRIEAMGGTLVALERGFFQREIQESAYRYQQEVERGQRTVIGVNKFATWRGEVTSPLLWQTDPQIALEATRRLADLRRRRDNELVNSLLGELRETARGSDNLVPVILRCVENLCTLGEICDVLRSVFGEYKETLVI